ncbi:MAG: hypothetical protein U9Q97_04965 [Acidobacteriota bacterium]|nr:hypothetical protein [Acidobacteriota bacterium]
MFSKILTIFLLLCTYSFGGVNGSVGALHEQCSKSLGLTGVFVEVNNQKFGVYLSAVGNRTKENYLKHCSFTNVSFGISYFIKKKFGTVLHCGFHERAYKQTSGYHLGPRYRQHPIDDNKSNGISYQYTITTYFTYGAGVLFYTFNNYVTFHLKITYIPSFEDTYVCAGLGIHIF